MVVGRKLDPPFVILAGIFVCGALTLGACGVGSGATTPQGTGVPTIIPTSPAAAAKVTCTLHQEPVTADMITATLSCTVTAAASDQTTFEATYTTGAAGAKGGTDVGCEGALHDGSGRCSVTFDQRAVSDKLGTVTVKLLPSQQRLGPLTPTPTP